MLVLDFKKTSTVTFKSPLSKYIKQKYALDPATFTADLQALDDMRIEATAAEVSANTSNRIWKYFGQLCYLQSRFLIDEKNVKISFPWYSMFTREKKSTSHYNVNFEKAGVLFNLAVLYSQLGLNEPKNPDGYKKAATHYMTAAGIFQHICDNLTAVLGLAPTSDLSNASLLSLVQLMLAQAQECILNKAIGEKTVKDGSLAKLAASAGEFYEAANDALRGTPVEACFGPSWTTFLQAKVSILYATAQIKKAAENLSKDLWGEEIARLNAAKAYIDNVLSMQKLLPAVVINECHTMMDHCNIQLARAHKDNDFIYHAAIPQELATVGRAILVKALPIEDLSSKTDIVGNPLFVSLVPIQIHETVSAYDEKKKTVVSRILDEFSNRCVLVDTALSELGLPGSIEAAEKPVGLPDTLLAKSREVQAMGGAHMLTDSLVTLEQLRTVDEEIIKDCITILQNEDREDADMRAQFGSKWSRAPSADLTVNLQAQIRKLQDLFTGAKRADVLVKSRFEQHIAHIESLGSSPDELESIIPACKVETAVGRTNENATKLKELIKDLQESKKKYDGMLAELKKTADEDKIVSHLLQVDTTLREDIVREALAKYDAKNEAFIAEIAHQTDLLDQIKSYNALFEETKSASPTLKQRAVALQNLDDAYQNFRSLTSNFEEGITFYTELQGHLTALKANCEEYCMSRKVEHRQMLQEIQAIAANMRNEAPPPKPQKPPAPLPATSPAPATYATTQRPIYTSGSSYAPSQHSQPDYSQPYHSGSYASSANAQPGQWNPSMPINYADNTPPSSNASYHQYQQPGQAMYQQQPGGQQAPYANNAMYSGGQPNQSNMYQQQQQPQFYDPNHPGGYNPHQHQHQQQGYQPPNAPPKPPSRYY